MTQKIVDGDRYTEVYVKVDPDSPLYVEPLGITGTAYQLAATATSTNTQLTSSCKRLTMRAVGADIRYQVGSAAQTATAESHFIANGERLDIGLPSTPHIAILRNASTNGTLEVTELL
jgi:hypothetical protein